MIDKKTGYYSLSDVLSYDPWKYFFIGIVGARSIGKTVAVQKLVIDNALYNNQDFAWIRTNPSAMKSTKKEFPDKVVKDKVYSKMEFKGDKFLIKNKIRGHFYSLSQAHNIRGSSVDWRKVRYIIFDEFNLQATERKYFDLANAFVDIIETIGRPEERIKQRKNGNKDIIPLTVIFMGNDTQESSALLERFNFVPTEFGRYVLPRKQLVLDYVEDSAEWKLLRGESPLAVLRERHDKQLGTADTRNGTPTIRCIPSLGQLENGRHVYRLWLSLNMCVDVFMHKEGLWITNDFYSEHIFRIHPTYKSYVVNRRDLRLRRNYDPLIIKALQLYLFSDRIAFSNTLLGRQFINSITQSQ